MALHVLLRRAIATAFCIWTLSPTIVHATAFCYFPDGTRNSDIPCRSGDGDSFCCAKGMTCTENKLCLGTPSENPINRGSCTDAQWNAVECPQFCRTFGQNSGDAMTDCGNGTYCCVPIEISQSGYDCCESKFSLGAAINFTTLGVAPSSTSSKSASAFSTTTTTLITSAAVSSTPTSSSITPASQTSTSSTSIPTTTSDNSGLGTGAKAGIAVGATLGALAVLALGIILWRRRKAGYSVGVPDPTKYTGVGSDSPGGVVRNQEAYEMPHNLDYGKDASMPVYEMATPVNERR